MQNYANQLITISFRTGKIIFMQMQYIQSGETIQCIKQNKHKSFQIKSHSMQHK